MKEMILHGNVNDKLQEIEPESIQCVVTSPPYWGLRDYGTAEWEGGDENCSHRGIDSRNVSGCKGLQYSKSDNGISSRNRVYSGDCKCGAIRIDRQLGLEETPELYVEKMVEVFREIKRVLKDDGTVWLNLGDSYTSSTPGQSGESDKQDSNVGSRFKGVRLTPTTKPKDLVGIPWMVAFALRSAGWYLRQDIIWHKPNPMPESVTDRCTKAHEYIFLLTKSVKYFYDVEAIQEEAAYDGRKDIVMKGSPKYSNGYAPTTTSPQSVALKGHVRWKKRKNDGTNYGGDGTGFQNHSGYDQLNNPYVRNKRSVWTITTRPYSEAHFATFPERLIEPCIKAGCPEGGIVLDPFMGAGTTGLVARKLNRDYVGVELNQEYIDIAEKRIFNEIGLFI